MENPDSIFKAELKGSVYEKLDYSVSNKIQDIVMSNLIKKSKTIIRETAAANFKNLPSGEADCLRYCSENFSGEQKSDCKEICRASAKGEREQHESNMDVINKISGYGREKKKTKCRSDGIGGVICEDSDF